MYIDKDSQGKYSLHDMDVQEAFSLKAMIEGAGLEERRIFNSVLTQLRKEVK